VIHTAPQSGARLRSVRKINGFLLCLALTEKGQDKDEEKAVMISLGAWMAE